MTRCCPLLLLLAVVCVTFCTGRASSSPSYGTCDSAITALGSESITFPDSLPYPFDALAPSISEETLKTHFGAHQRGYVTKLNAWLADDASKELLQDVRCIALSYAEEGASIPLKIVSLHQQLPDRIPKPVYNLAAQIYNHALYFASLTSHPVEMARKGPLRQLVVQQYGSWDLFATEFKKRAVAHFGSGWVWLIADVRRNVLHILDTYDAEIPFAVSSHKSSASSNIPLLVCDVWEHAYYLDYKNLRDQYYDNWWSKVDWVAVQKRLTDGKLEGAAVGGYPTW